MKKYKGEIANFPEEVVEWMLDEQERQGNKRDVNVFENDKFVSRAGGGIDWRDTNECGGFCENVIDDENFDLFFEKYPQAKPKSWITEFSELLKKRSLKLAKRF